MIQNLKLILEQAIFWFLYREESLSVNLFSKPDSIRAEGLVCFAGHVQNHSVSNTSIMYVSTSPLKVVIYLSLMKGMKYETEPFGTSHRKLTNS